MTVDGRPGATGEALWQIPTGVAWTDDFGHVVVLALTETSSTPLALDGTSCVTWRMLAAHGPVSHIDLAQRVADEFDGDISLIQHDIQLLLNQLREFGVVTVKPNA